MLIINNWRDLEEYGIEWLTGEACAFSMRTLCDVNADGQAILDRIFGYDSASSIDDVRNPGKINGKDKVGSVLIPNDLFNTIAVFALVNAGCVYIMQDSNQTIGFQPIDFTAENIDQTNASIRYRSEKTESGQRMSEIYKQVKEDASKHVATIRGYLKDTIEKTTAERIIGIILLEAERILERAEWAEGIAACEGKKFRVITVQSIPGRTSSTGDQNVHQMSGKIVEPLNDAGVVEPSPREKIDEAEVSSAIWKLMHERGMSFIEVGKELCMTPATVRRILNKYPHVTLPPKEAT